MAIKTPKNERVKRAFSIDKKDGAWRFVEVGYTDSGKLVDIQHTQPDLKSIAVERFKINAFNYWSKYDE